MYTYEQRLAAVKLYIKYGNRAAPVIRELGYPDRHMLIKWYKEYQETGELHKGLTRSPKYSEEEKRQALQHYLDHGRSITQTVKALGYPSQSTFKLWLNEALPDRKKRCRSGGANGFRHFAAYCSLANAKNLSDICLQPKVLSKFFLVQTSV